MLYSINNGMNHTSEMLHEGYSYNLLSLLISCLKKGRLLYTTYSFEI